VPPGSCGSCGGPKRTRPPPLRVRGLRSAQADCLPAAKHFAREIADWRTQYKVQEGHPPTLKDIAALEHISEVYEEYTKLNDFVSQREGGGGANGPEDVNETATNPPQLQLHPRRKVKSSASSRAKEH
jgi:hypothetical protein